MRTVETVELVALSCPQCGGALLEGGLGCRFCGSQLERVSAANKPRVAVAGENRDLQVDGITFDRRSGFDDGQLEAIAGQVSAAMASEPGEKIKHYLDFSLPLEPKPGRPAALLVAVHRGDGEGLTVLFEMGHPADTHQRLRDEGRVLSFPSKTL